ncbi:hypothetical protein ACSFBM_28735 [Variovorax sp. GB1R11]|uniref:hypothetical protein n=1 Tax=Variovorax sp. GB1R11 TaxID=3443741 RepID=UPI003F4575E3
MSSLKRSINTRLKALEAEYGFSKLPTAKAKKRILETLQDFGLVRPTLLAELMKLRNDIEHNDAQPPDQATCHMYVDVVWYFLKSTDPLLDMVVDSLVYEDSETKSALTIEFHTASDWKMSVAGVVHIGLLHETPDLDRLKLQDFRVVRQSGDHTIHFNAEIEPSSEALLLLVHDYFGAQGYFREDSGA